MNTDSHRLAAEERALAAGSAPYPHEALTRQIIGAAYEVHRQLGYGYLERVYENALAVELKTRGVPAVQQASINVHYKGALVGVYIADVLVDNVVLCEIKAGDSIADAHQAQLLNYLKATALKVGLILNFGPKRVAVKRMVH
jgi:GxxExxY protein